MTNHSEHFYTPGDGIKMFYRFYPGAQGGTKTPILCMHGLTRNSRDFEDISPRLAAMGHDVIAIDVRGRGFSDYDPDPARYIPLTYVNDIFGMLEERGITQVATLGTSMGGLMTMIMAKLKPGLITRACINDIGPVLQTEGIERIKGYVGGSRDFATWDDASAALRAINGIAFPKETSDAFWLAFAKRTCREDETGRIRLDYDPEISKPVKGGDVAPVDMWPFFEALRGIPLLLIRGELTDLLSPDTVKDMKTRHGKMDVVQVPDVGHAPLLTEEAAWSAISTFY
ncbi:alpha/beta fold hydrolase [Woodsholea maritima]|uniref:alpha/beta fold hydrolase n=1 Tax=Woodsholea maritima TaxID=240237 RepID=UPI00037A66D0|nr:alpha/beta hydrolase [Woodsholea maritima]